MKELKIQVPEGYEVDKENSTFECIKFKKKKLDFTTIATHCDVYNAPVPSINTDFSAKLIAISKLLIVAKHLNNGWVPNWNNYLEHKYYLNCNTINNLVDIHTAYIDNSSLVYFKSSELAAQAIEILGVDIIKTALLNNY